MSPKRGPGAIFCKLLKGVVGGHGGGAAEGGARGKALQPRREKSALHLQNMPSVGFRAYKHSPSLSLSLSLSQALEASGLAEGQHSWLRVKLQKEDFGNFN